MKKSRISDIKPVKQKKVSASAYSVSKKISWLVEELRIFIFIVRYLSSRYPRLWQRDSKLGRWFHSFPERSSGLDSIWHRWTKFVQQLPNEPLVQKTRLHNLLGLFLPYKIPTNRITLLKKTIFVHFFFLLDMTLFMPIPRRSTFPALNAVYCTRLWRRIESEFGPPTISLHGKSVACWKNEISGHNLLEN